MTTTLTMDAKKLGEAKKYRDGMRNRVRKDLTTMCAKYNITMFEAAHAVLDSVIQNIDTNATMYGQTEMPNQLAQTLLSYTQAMLDKTEEEPTPKSKSLFSYSMSSSPSSSATFNLTLPTTVAKKKKKKLDKFVTTDDIAAEIVWSGTALGSAAIEAQKKALAYLQSKDPESFYVKGGGYFSASDPWASGGGGYKKVIVKIPKTAPYVSAEMLHTLKLQLPANGFKWRKLKNKTIYKLQDYSKSKSTLHSALDTPLKAVPGKVVAVDPVTQAVKGVETSLSYSESTAKLYSKLPDGFAWMQSPYTKTYYVGKSLDTPLKKAAATNIKVSAIDPSDGKTTYFELGTVYPSKMMKTYSMLTPGYKWVKSLVYEQCWIEKFTDPLDDPFGPEDVNY